MSVLLSIDPGKRASGCAIFVHSELMRAAFVLGSKDAERANAWVTMAVAVRRWVDESGYSPTSLAIEGQKVYAHGRSKGDPQDLLDLSSVTGAICYAFKDIPATVYLPAEHKGQVPKSIIHERMRKRLTPAEISRIELPRAKSLHHNVLDGVQIGIVHLGRM